MTSKKHKQPKTWKGIAERYGFSIEITRKQQRKFSRIFASPIKKIKTLANKLKHAPIFTAVKIYSWPDDIPMSKETLIRYNLCSIYIRMPGGWLEGKYFFAGTYLKKPDIKLFFNTSSEIAYKILYSVFTKVISNKFKLKHIR